jgi:hypothetical protein
MPVNKFRGHEPPRLCTSYRDTSYHPSRLVMFNSPASHSKNRLGFSGFSQNRTGTSPNRHSCHVCDGYTDMRHLMNELLYFSFIMEAPTTQWRKSDQLRFFKKKKKSSVIEVIGLHTFQFAKFVGRDIIPIFHVLDTELSASPVHKHPLILERVPKASSNSIEFPFAPFVLCVDCLKH